MLSFTTQHEWLAEGELFEAGEHEVAKPSKALTRLASHAHAAGVINVTEGLDLSTVEPQQDSEAKLADAMGEWVEPAWNEDGTRTAGYWTGPWYEGHRAQMALDAEQRDQAAVTPDVEGQS